MKAVVSLSGGLDSAVLLSELLANGHSVVAVTFDYGSKHGQYEIKAAKEIAEALKVEHRIIDVTNIFAGFDSALMKSDSREIPEGHYEGETMKLTVVPGRNMIFASILTGFAQSINFDVVAIAMHAGDHAIYPDCRPEFQRSMNQAILDATEYQISLLTPFLNLTKGQIVGIGIDNNTPFELTRTCYKDQSNPCGKCGSCTERLEAFKENKKKDPAKYAK